MFTKYVASMSRKGERGGLLLWRREPGGRGLGPPMRGFAPTEKNQQSKLREANTAVLASLLVLQNLGQMPRLGLTAKQILR
jgi:hypothetical protein